MTYFADDLKAYLVAQNLIDADAYIDFAEDTTENAGQLTTLNFYDSNAALSEYSVQFVCRRENQLDALDVVAGIYNHLFTDEPIRPKYLTINNTKCCFMAKTRPAFLKRENQMYNYYFDCQINAQKI